MKILILTLLLGLSLADDLEKCVSKCSLRYDAEDLTNSCKDGCSFRSGENGLGMFSRCMAKCDEKFSNETGEDASCRYACSLPVVSTLFMSFDYSNGQNKWKIVQDGKELSSPADINSNLLALKAPVSQETDSSEDASIEDFISARNNLVFANVERKMMDMMRQINENMFKSSREMDEPLVARSRPGGHFWSQSAHPVDNLTPDGEPMILVQPVNEVPQTRYRSNLIAAFHWALIAVGVAALLTTLCAVFVFVRNLKLNNYRRMNGESAFPVFSRIQIQSAEALPVKKVPEEGWVTSTEPSGVPPPAYDQVSIHSLKKEQPSEPSE